MQKLICLSGIHMLTRQIIMKLCTQVVKGIQDLYRVCFSLQERIETGGEKIVLTRFLKQVNLSHSFRSKRPYVTVCLVIFDG